jgi:hypothetical protein
MQQTTPFFKGGLLGFKYLSIPFIPAHFNLKKGGGYGLYYPPYPLCPLENMGGPGRVHKTRPPREGGL